MSAVRSGDVEAWCEGTGSQRLTISAGESWSYLQYRAMGFVMARIQGKICVILAYTEESIFGQNLPQPEVQWWVAVESADGSSLGWLLVSDDQARFGKREF